MYCVLECVRICHYDDVQVQVCNNASMCTIVNQHERIHVHALCVSCKEITNRNHCNRRRVSELSRNKTRILARIMANWKLYTRLEDYASA